MMYSSPSKVLQSLVRLRPRPPIDAQLMKSKKASLTQLYAFFYAPPKGEESGEPSTPQIFRDEFTRMGVGSRTKAWRFTELNKEGQVRFVQHAIPPCSNSMAISHSSALHIHNSFAYPPAYPMPRSHMHPNTEPRTEYQY
jgi:hypothetical protein